MMNLRLMDVGCVASRDLLKEGSSRASPHRYGIAALLVQEGAGKDAESVGTAEDGLPCQEGARCATPALSLCRRERQLTLSWRPVWEAALVPPAREAAGEAPERSWSKPPEESKFS